MPRFALRISEAQLTVWKEAANKEGLTLSGFIRHRIECALRMPKQSELTHKMSRCLDELEEYLAHLMFLPPNL